MLVGYILTVLKGGRVNMERFTVGMDFKFCKMEERAMLWRSLGA